ncbi:MAG: hypothetical protein ABI221_03540 [Candidatus Saccharimonadales bacterium]
MELIDALRFIQQQEAQHKALEKQSTQDVGPEGVALRERFMALGQRVVDLAGLQAGLIYRWPIGRDKQSSKYRYAVDLGEGKTLTVATDTIQDRGVYIPDSFEEIRATWKFGDGRAVREAVASTDLDRVSSAAVSQNLLLLETSLKVAEEAPLAIPFSS